MHAMIMAGGMGSRLGLSLEKPLLEINGRKMISFVIDALLGTSVEKIYAVVSPRTPLTREYLSTAYGDRLSVLEAPGSGYVPDYIFAVEKLGIREPVLILMADLPVISADAIEEVLGAYWKAKKSALAVYAPLSIYRELGLKPATVFRKNNRLIVPCGVNILLGAKIREEQEEHVFISKRRELAVNVNTIEDLKFVEKYKL